MKPGRAPVSGAGRRNRFDDNGLAIELDRTDFCSFTGCSYKQCIIATTNLQPTDFIISEETTRTVQEHLMKFCTICPDPLGYRYTPVTMCLKDLSERLNSLLPCDVISESSYYDKYGICYGKIARLQGEQVCVSIVNLDHRKLCMRFFQGGFEELYETR